MLLARWGSQVVLKYIAEAPLTALTRLYKQRLAAAHIGAGNAASSSSLSADDLERAIAKHMDGPLRLLRSSADALEVLRADVERNAHALACTAADLTAVKDSVGKHESVFSEQIILNIKDQCYHRSPSLGKSKPADAEVRRCYKCFGR